MSNLFCIIMAKYACNDMFAIIPKKKNQTAEKMDMTPWKKL